MTNKKYSTRQEKIIALLQNKYEAIQRRKKKDGDMKKDDESETKSEVENVKPSSRLRRSKKTPINYDENVEKTDFTSDGAT